MLNGLGKFVLQLTYFVTIKSQIRIDGCFDLNVKRARIFAPAIVQKLLQRYRRLRKNAGKSRSFSSHTRDSDWSDFAEVGALSGWDVGAS